MINSLLLSAVKLNLLLSNIDIFCILQIVHREALLTFTLSALRWLVLLRKNKNYD